jgi:hypothetical protein
MGHEDSAFEVGFGEDVREGGRMVEMETGLWSVSSALHGMGMARGSNDRDEHLRRYVDTRNVCMARWRIF